MHLLTNESACSISVILQNAIVQIPQLKYQILFGLMRLSLSFPYLKTNQLLIKIQGFFLGQTSPQVELQKSSLEQEKLYTMLKA